jgi:hypothetical protein
MEDSQLRARDRSIASAYLRPPTTEKSQPCPRGRSIDCFDYEVTTKGFMVSHIGPYLSKQVKLEEVKQLESILEQFSEGREFTERFMQQKKGAIALAETVYGAQEEIEIAKLEQDYYHPIIAILALILIKMNKIAKRVLPESSRLTVEISDLTQESVVSLTGMILAIETDIQKALDIMHLTVVDTESEVRERSKTETKIEVERILEPKIAIFDNETETLKISEWKKRQQKSKVQLEEQNRQIGQKKEKRREHERRKQVQREQEQREQERQQEREKEQLEKEQREKVQREKERRGVIWGLNSLENRERNKNKEKVLCYA